MRKYPFLFNKMLVIGILILFAGMSVIPSNAINVKINKPSSLSLGNNALYVGGTGEGNYTSIQDAIDNATNGDTVLVLDDSSPYYENVVIDKELNLFGENKDTTVIDGMKKSYVIDVQAGNVHIRGFTIKNGTKNLPNAPSGIWCQSFEGSSYNNLHIEHNIITENPNGINLLRSHNSNISNNIIKSNDNHGLHIWLSENFTCHRNDITNHVNGYSDIDMPALFFLKTPNIDISYNMISGNSYALKMAFKCHNALVSNNIFTDNGPGSYDFQLFNSSNVIIKNNYFNNMAVWEIDIIDWCYNNLIYHNDVYGIPYDHEGVNMWDDGYPSGGNYWSGYEGLDADGDGIGDSPFTFQYGEDRYPLMEPYNDNWTPYARFSYLEDKYNVSFDASLSYDFQGSIVSYEWDFGDGTTGEGEIIIHDYKESGKYKVILKVTDNDGTTDTASWEVLLFPMPDLSCEGNLVWEGVNHGEKIEDSFIVENIGDPESLLDWKIGEYPNWGEWTFTPSNGEDLTPEAGQIIVQVEAVAPNESNKEFNGTIKIVNSEDSSDFCEIDVLLKTPRDKSTISSLLLQFLERFPLLERLLSFFRVI